MVKQVSVTEGNTPKKVTSSRSNRPDFSIKAALTMDELLSKTGYSIHSFSRGEKVKGKVIEKNSRSLILDIGAKSEGLVVDREFEATKHFISNLSVGDVIDAYVIVPEDRGQILLSLRDTAEDYSWNLLKDSLNNGTEIDTKVESVAKGGLVVIVYGLKAYIPASHIGSQLAKNLNSSVDKHVKAKAIEVDREKNRIVLSEKAVSEADILAAQEKVLKNIKEGERFAGKVVGVVSFGAFVQIQKDDINLDGLVHLSELSWQKVSDPSGVIKVGDEVEIVVIGKEGSRLAFSVKQAQKDPWAEVEKKYKEDMKVKGKVTKMGDFGAIIEIEPGVEGLIHLSRIPAELSLKEGSEVDCFIEKIDQKNHKISLGIALKAKPIGYK